MLKGTREGILKKVQRVSIHGQLSWDLFFTDPDDPDGQVHLARMGPEAVAPNIERAFVLKRVARLILILPSLVAYSNAPQSTSIDLNQAFALAKAMDSGDI